MGIGPIVALPKVLKLTDLSPSDSDLIELNEAFASQSLAIVRELGLDMEKLNVNGGAIALGHPMGATGTKLTVQLMHELKRRTSRSGMVTMCIGGGMGAASIFENRHRGKQKEQEGQRMEVDQAAISQMRAITISREYGSGGGEIAARLAKRLGWQVIDHEVVVQVAQHLGCSVPEAAKYDERAEGLVSRIFNTVQVLHPHMPLTVPLQLMIDSRTYNEARRRVIYWAAMEVGHVVIVGRGAQVLLARRRSVLHVRVVAPLEQRVAYVMQREGLSQAEARARIQLKDRNRIHYLQVVHGQNAEDAHLYDLVVNTSVLHLDSVVDLICLALERKARRLSVKTGELGPGTGLPRYAGQPGDFPPPETAAQPPT
jgi:cytidylate kinase